MAADDFKTKILKSIRKETRQAKAFKKRFETIDRMIVIDLKAIAGFRRLENR